MKTTDIILAGIVGTTAFTAFSYLVSKTMDKNFKEPRLLGKMVDDIMPGMQEKESQFTGWLIHYLTGVAFAGAYNALIDSTGIKPSVRNGVIAGAVSGFPAGLLWDTSLKLHPTPPRKRTANYYLHLALGHAIFGAASFFVFGLLNKHRDEKYITSPIDEQSADSKLSQYATAGS